MLLRTVSPREDRSEMMKVPSGEEHRGADGQQGEAARLAVGGRRRRLSWRGITGLIRMAPGKRMALVNSAPWRWMTA
jgi:hypothetical protein